jgi:hypothetical protein
MSTRDVAAAQSTFSDEEMEALFRTLGLAGDPHNEADRARLVELLRDLAEDPANARTAGAAAETGRERMSDPLGQMRLAAHGPFTPIFRRRRGSIDSSIWADVPSAGRDLGDTADEAL